MSDIKAALITGGTKGIGFSIAESFLANNIKLCITGRTQESIDKALQKLNHHEDLLGIVADVRDKESMSSLINSMHAKFGRLDYLIANAGIGHFASIEDLTYEQWDEVIDINLTGVFNTIKPAINYLKDSKGYIITIASLAGTNFFAGGAAYNASKFGLVGFTQAIMLDLRKHGIKTSTIMPGSVSTYFNNRVPSEMDAWKIQPEDIAQICLDLIKMPANVLPSKVEVRPTQPPSKK